MTYEMIHIIIARSKYMLITNNYHINTRNKFHHLLHIETKLVLYSFDLVWSNQDCAFDEPV